MSAGASVLRDGRWRAAGYWSLAILLTVFGFVDLIAIGAPFLVLGLALLVLGRRRHERTVFVPGLAGTIGLIAGSLLLLPLGCTSSATGSSAGILAEGPTRCGTALWFDYVGASHYSPPFAPALIAGALLGIASWFVASRLIARRSRTERALES
jgi:hypothetical protein